MIRRLAVGTLAVALVAAAGLAWVAARGANARDHLTRAAALVLQLRGQLDAGDVDAATATLAALRVETAAARAETADPAWRAGQRAPVVGYDLAAVRTVTVALDDLARDALPAMVETAGRVRLGTLVPRDGRVDLRGLARAAPRLADAEVAVALARDRIAAIEVDSLATPVRDAVVRLRDGLSRAAVDTATVARTAALLPAMLGADGPRTYLVLLQNLAEPRATGGMPGAYVVLRADRGAVEIVEQGAPAEFERPVLPLDKALRSLYSERMATYAADVNFSPDFPTAAVLAREMYRLRSGRTVDGVLATDPVALSYLLVALGPVAVPGGPTLTAGNAVRVLLSDVYARSGSSPDEYFAAAARAIFTALLRRPLDARALLAQVARAAGERRILVWTADERQRARLDGTVLSGALPALDGARPAVGLFVNDGSGAKLGYYLRPAASLAVGGCRPDRRRELALRVTLGSTAPRSGLPPSVLGLGLAGDPYTLRTYLAVYSPTRGAIGPVRLDGSTVRVGAGFQRRRAVAIVRVDLRPGQTRTVETTVFTGAAEDGWRSGVTPSVWTTPGVADWPVTVHPGGPC